MAQEEHAFPHPSGAQGCDGMTLRDWFAGQAIGAIARICIHDSGEQASANYPAYCASKAYHFADAMIAERNRRTGHDD